MTISWLDNEVFLETCFFFLPLWPKLVLLSSRGTCGSSTLRRRGGKWRIQHDTSHFKCLTRATRTREHARRDEPSGATQPQPAIPHTQTRLERGEQENEWEKRRALTSIDISISGTRRYQSICLDFPPLPSPCSPCKAAETIIEIGTFRPCMFRIPGVLPAETVIDQIVEHITGPFTNVPKRNQFFVKKEKKKKKKMK